MNNDKTNKNKDLEFALQEANGEIDRLRKILDVILPFSIAGTPPPVAAVLAQIAMGELPPSVFYVMEAYGFDDLNTIPSDDDGFNCVMEFSEKGCFEPGKPMSMEIKASFGDGSDLRVKARTAPPPADLVTDVQLTQSPDGKLHLITDEGLSDALSLFLASIAGRLLTGIKVTINSLPRPDGGEWSPTEPEA